MHFACVKYTYKRRAWNKFWLCFVVKSRHQSTVPFMKGWVKMRKHCQNLHSLRWMPSFCWLFTVAGICCYAIYFPHQIQTHKYYCFVRVALNAATSFKTRILIIIWHGDIFMHVHFSSDVLSLFLPGRYSKCLSRILSMFTVMLFSIWVFFFCGGYSISSCSFKNQIHFWYEHFIFTSGYDGKCHSHLKDELIQI